MGCEEKMSVGCLPSAECDGKTSVVLTLGLYPSWGGPAKSIPSFAKALGAPVISWVDPVQNRGERLIWDQTVIVRTSAAPVLRQLMWASQRETREAEKLVASASLVSCHILWRWHAVWLWRTAKQFNVPYWFVPHGCLDPYVFRKGAFEKRLFLALFGRRIMKDAAAVICSTRREFEKIAGVVGVGKPHAIIPWPLDSIDFRERDDSRRAAVRRRLGIPPDAFVLLYLGRLHPMKRPIETIRAFATAGMKDAHLLILGNDFGVTSVDCCVEAQRAGVADRVHVVGAVYGEGKFDFLDAADAYISLSHRENFNFTAAECMASGLPLVLSPGNDLAGELQDVPCGRFLQTDKESEAIGAIHELAKMTPEARAGLGATGAAWARRELTFERFGSRICAFADEIVRSSARRL